MARFSDLDEFFSPGLTLTVRGKEYTLPLPSAELGLWCRRMAQAGVEIHAASSDEELDEAARAAADRMKNLPPLPGEVPFEERLLGPALAQMTADGVPDPYIQFCAQTAYVWIVGGEAAAERYWTSGGHPEALRPANRQERRAAQRTGQRSTAGATGTPAPVSSSGTRSPTTSSRRKSRRGRGSAGRKS